MNNEEERVDLSEYLPEFLKEYHEIREILGTENEEFNRIEQIHLQCIDDRFVVSCGENGLERFERLLNISPLADDSPESRRFRVLSKWNTSAFYNYAYLENQLKILCGEKGYRLKLDFAGPALDVKIELTSKNMIDSVREMLGAVLPCNVLANVSLFYNQYQSLGKFKYGELEQFTYAQIREDVIL